MKLHEYVYDKSGNLYQVTAHMAGKTYRLSYDLLDRLMRMTDEQGNSYTYTYDVNNCMVKMDHTCGSSSADTSYTYDKDSREVTTKCATSYTRTTTYDKFGRVTKRSWNTPAVFNTIYTYFDNGNNRFSLPKTIKNGTELLEYAYDANGNITSIKDSAGESTYQYDELNQLIRENNHVLDKTLTYHYDLGGNLTAVKEYAFTTADALPAQPQKTETGTYSAAWKDQLLTWDGTAMTYDAIGNMLTKGTTSYTWIQGRKLSGVENGKSIQYFYDHTGARTKKVVDGIETEYRMAGDLLVSEKTGTQTYWYRYDSGANLVSVTIGGEIYFYVRNAQNDVIALIDAEGNTVVKYIYDSWGKVLSITGSLADTIGVQNPFRYRGYYYDNETGMYYLRSRYYDPGVRRFICADGYASTGQGLVCCNMYAYCENNPICRWDNEGTLFEAIAGLFKGVVDTFIGWASNSVVAKGAATAAVADGPSPILDIVAVAATGISYIYYLTTQKAEKSKVNVKVKAVEKSEKDVIIYRYGRGNPSNLTPKEKDYTSPGGLSFSDIPGYPSVMTTVNTINATGILVVVNDRPHHYSVYPIGASVKQWSEAGSMSLWTQTLKSIVVKWDGGK